MSWCWGRNGVLLMSNSLRDALTKAGVVSTSKAKVAAQQAKKTERQDLHTKRTGGVVQSEAAKAAAKAQQEKLARDREMNRAREAALALKAARAEAKRVLRERMQNDAAAAIPFHFVEGTRVCHLYVTETQREQLTKGELAVVALGERHYLVPSDTSEKVRTLVPDVFVHRLTHGQATEDKCAHDDPYAAYQIPDDLMW